MTIGEQIKTFRKKAGYTQKQLAEICNVAEITIRQYELGKRQPRIEQLEKIANALDVSLIQIMEHIPLEQYKTTDEYKKTMIKVSAYEGILAILQHIYGNIEEKDVQDKYGEAPYYLVGKGKNSFVLYEENIEKLLNYVTTTIPLIVDEMKDTRPEQEIINEIKTDLNSPETIATVKKFLAEHKEAVNESPQED